MATKNSTSTLMRANRPTAPLPPAAVSALARLELAFAPAPLDPSARLKAVAAECRSRSAAAVTAEDFEQLLCVQDELAMCRCQLAAKAGA